MLLNGWAALVNDLTTQVSILSHNLTAYTQFMDSIAAHGFQVILQHVLFYITFIIFGLPVIASTTFRAWTSSASGSRISLHSRSFPSRSSDHHRHNREKSMEKNLAQVSVTCETVTVCLGDYPADRKEGAGQVETVYEEADLAFYRTKEGEVAFSTQEA